MKGAIRLVLAGFFVGLTFVLPTMFSAAVAFLVLLIVLSLFKEKR